MSLAVVAPWQVIVDHAARRRLHRVQRALLLEPRIILIIDEMKRQSEQLGKGKPPIKCTVRDYWNVDSLTLEALVRKHAGSSLCDWSAYPSRTGFGGIYKFKICV